MEVFFSIIIPTYNRASFLGNTIVSVLQQNFWDWEVIIVDDGSLDNTEEVVKSFDDLRIKYLYKQNEERSIARNYGIQQASGQYICFLDSDDEYYPDHLSSLYKKIESENFPVGVFNTGMIEFRNGEKIPRPVFNSSEYKHPVYFVWEKFMLPTSVCVHREILEKNKFPEQFHVWEDTHLWLRILIQYPFFQIENYSCQWNVHPEGTVEIAFNKVKSSHVKHYLNCISHLANNYKELMQPFLGQQDFVNYQLKKLKMFLHITFNRKQYYIFGKLYLYGLLNIDSKAVNRFVKSLLSIKVKQKVHAFKN
jgi:glycosyltransferase involved in cell wall biosynthesis